MPFRLITVLAIVALAVTTWFLSSPGRTPALGGRAAQAETPGYYFGNAILTDYDAEGLPSIRVGAGRIDQIDHGAEVALFDVRVDYQPPSGQGWVLTGETAHVEPGGQAVDVAGNVRLQGDSRGGAPVIRTDALRYDVPLGMATTPDEVHIDFERQTMSARGLVANLRDRSLRLESRVNGRFYP